MSSPSNGSNKKVIAFLLALAIIPIAACGWVNLSSYRTVKIVELWSLIINGSPEGGIKIADLNKDSHVEVVAVTLNGRIYVINGSTGEKIWSASTGFHIRSQPAIADMNKDGILDVVVLTTNGDLFVLSGDNGSLIWRYHISLWQPHVIAAPTIYDVDNDGEYEIFTGGAGFFVALNSSGKEIWRISIDGDAYSFPAVGDIDNDGFVELVFGTTNKTLYVVSPYNGAVLWTVKINGKVRASPSLADIDKDGYLDIVVGDLKGNAYLICGKNKSVVWNQTLRGFIDFPPVLADFDGDGYLDIIFACSYYGSSTADWASLYCVRGKTRKILWIQSYYSTCCSRVIVGDTNRDGFLDVIVGSVSSTVIWCFDGRSGRRIWTYNINGYFESVGATPAIGDINNDGDNEIIIGTSWKRIIALKVYGSLVSWGSLGNDLCNTNNIIFSDRDGDGVPNDLEESMGMNLDSPDSDGDSMPDGYEITFSLDPTNSSDATLDVDGDGLNNLQEFSLGTDPRAWDSDWDKVPDGWEISHGFNPLNPGINEVITFYWYLIVLTVSIGIGLLLWRRKRRMRSLADL